jgi:RecA-family ATPase
VPEDTSSEFGTGQPNPPGNQPGGTGNGHNGHGNEFPGGGHGNWDEFLSRPLPPLPAPAPPEEPQLDLGEWDFGAANIIAAELPPRGWLLGNWLCRQFVSALIADGAGGKTATRLACALALAANRGDIVGEHVFERVPVLFVCFEDGETELKRRVCSAMLEHGISNEDIKGYLFVRAITASELKLAITNDFNKAERGPLVAALDASITRRKVGAVFLDPLVKTHAVNANSNKDMDLVIEILADVAIRHDVAVDTPHHVSKGTAAAGNADGGRGRVPSRTAPDWSTPSPACQATKPLH